MSLSSALAPLAQYPQFVCFRRVIKDERTGKSDKFPVHYVTGEIVDAQKSDNWTDIATATAAAVRLGPDHGVGFVLTPEAGFFCLDIDNCRLPDNTWTPLAHELCARFAGAAVEVSVSGNGLHIFGRGTIPPHGKKNVAFGIELYSEKRFIALGSNAQGNAATDCSVALAEVVAHYFPFDAADQGDDGAWTDTACEGWSAHDDDEQLIAHACSIPARIDAAEVFGEGSTRVSFADLWHRNVDALSKRYKKAGDRNEATYDASSADMALAQHLAYWTGKNMTRMDRLMRASGLKRAKYDEREDYLRDTIRRACARQEKVAQLGAKPGAAPVGVGIMSVKRGEAVPAMYQPTFFHGCVYVKDRHAILIPGGAMVDEKKFKVLYGGRLFAMDATNTKQSKNAYEAFLESQVNEPPMADSTCFRPDLPPAIIVDEGGRTYVNTWWPYEVPRKKGDATLFLQHVAKLLPDTNDQAILLAYLAACVQHRGVKFQWAPLIQGTEGNGKSIITECMFEAIGRKYYHRVTASKIAGRFNDWVLDKLFYGVDDIYVPDAQREVIEILKPMITGETIEIEAKGRDQFTAMVCGNFLFNSNHKDAIRKTRNDRRFAVFYTAQQSKADIMRDGMDAAYFERLQGWLRNEGGYAIVTDFLLSHAIPDALNPAKSCRRAPDTSSTEEAISASVGGVEQEVLEAIASGRQGFAGGFVSTKHLSDLIDTVTRKRFTPNKRLELMESLDYIPHPGLPGGRPNNAPAVDGARSILFVKRGHPAAHISGVPAITKAYNDAQLQSVGFGVTTNEGV